MVRKETWKQTQTEEDQTSKTEHWRYRSIREGLQSQTKVIGSKVIGSLSWGGSFELSVKGQSEVRGGGDFSGGPVVKTPCCQYRGAWVQGHRFDPWSGELKSHTRCCKWSESESHSIVSYSLRPHGLHSPWNSPSQNTGVGSLSLLQGIFPTQGSNPGLPHSRRILYQLIYVKSTTNHFLKCKVGTFLQLLVTTILITDLQWK